MGFRITLLIGCFSLLYAVLLFNVYNLQLERGNYYRAKASSLHSLTGALIPARGNIYFTSKDGSDPAALTKQYPVLYIAPKEVAEALTAGTVSIEEFVQVLSKETGVSEGKLRDILRQTNDPYEPLVRRASDEQVAFVGAGSLPGVHIEYDPFRFYPSATTASHALGFASTNDSVWEGLYGIELYYDETLRGEVGAADGDVFKAPKNGEDLHLTIDRTIQDQAEAILKKLIEEHSAEGGTVIVQNPKTGAILAMASQPSFDPNNYGKFEIRTFLNPAVQAIYEPGSVFKVITMAAGIDAGKITPETTYTDTGSLTLNGRTIRNWDLKAHGKMSMTQVIEKSINTGAVFAQQQLGRDLFYDYLVKFGFEGKTRIDLPGEVAGSLVPLKVNAREINFATASFGQGISVTPIELISALSTIANRGVLVRPYVNVSLKEKVVGRVISEQASQDIIGMMVSAVDNARIAKIEGYTVAGKTGTAQVPDFIHGGYTSEVINTYVGFAPAYNPRFVALVKLDKPAGAPLAGLTVVPAFRDLAQFILTYYNVPPDRVQN